MIDGCPYNRQTDGDVYPSLNSKHLHRAVTLVVIHRHDNVEVAPAGAEKEGVRRQRTLHVPAAGLAGTHGRLDFRLFFAISEEAVLTRMGINAANTDARVCDSGASQCFLSTDDRALDQARLDPGNGVDQTNVRGNMDDLELRRREQHRDLRCTG